jgi:hypothetical protein
MRLLCIAPFYPFTYASDSLWPMALLSRGVHREPVLSCDGHPIMISVNHLGQEVQRRVILPGENPVRVAAILWEHLDLVDPEHTRRGFDRGQIASLAAACCTAFALNRLALLSILP